MSSKKKQKKHFSCSLIVPVHNGGSDFQKCLAALGELKPAPHEIIIVADGCTDGGKENIPLAGARIIRLAKRGGPARARNKGAAAASGDYLFFVDADVVVPANALTVLADVFTSQPEPAAVIGSYDDAPDKKNFLSQYRNLFHHYVHQNSSKEATTFWGACGTVRREAFNAVQGFDETYSKPSIEDIDLGYRLVLAGYTIHLIKTLQVKHLKKWTAFSLLRTDLIHRAIPWTELIHRQRMFARDLNLDMKNRVSVFLTMIILPLLLLAPFWNTAFQGVILATGCLLIINFRVYRFFYRKRGLAFAVQCVPWHFLYFCSCGAGFLIGTVRYRLGVL